MHNGWLSPLSKTQMCLKELAEQFQKGGTHLGFNNNHYQHSCTLFCSQLLLQISQIYYSDLDQACASQPHFQKCTQLTHNTCKPG